MNNSLFQFISFPGKIHLIDSDQKLLAIKTELNSVTALGFDTETKPSFKKGQVHQVALLQLATESDAYLIRLHQVTQLNMIQEIFENEQIIKVGVAVKDDLKQLQKIFNFTAKNFIELQNIAKEKGLKNFGLKGMTQEVLNMTLTKGPKLTNWEAHELMAPQLSYAATDAWIGLKLYNKLLARA